MAGDGASALAEEFDRWIEERAAELDASRETVLARVLAGIGEPANGDEGESDGGALAVGADAPLGGARLDGVEERIAALDDRVTAIEGRERVDPDRVTEVAGRVEDLTERIEAVAEEVTAAEGDADGALADRVAALEDDLDEKIGDVRERVIQVKRETDGKAPADHDHGDLRQRVDRAATTVGEFDSRLDDLEGRVEGGFDNFEEILEYLTETSEDLETRTETLARATIGLRDRVAELETERSARAVADDIRETANRNGDATATCESCSGRIRLGLLSRPECPHCAATFEDVEPSSGLFGTATLLVGPPPALDGETTAAASPGDLFDEEEDDRRADGGSR